MDAKVTKDRLKNTLSYDWIKIAVTVIVLILLVEILFGVVKEKLNDGQKFNVYYYYTIEESGTQKLAGLIDEDTFSFDVKQVNIASINDENEYEFMQTRVVGNEIDMFVIDNYLTYDKTKPQGTENADLYAESNFKLLIDNYNFADYYTLIKDAKTYLDGFYTDGVLDKLKVESNFKKRTKGENVYRNKNNYKKGVENEIKRIEKLKADVEFLSQVLENPSYNDLFITYTKYEHQYYSDSLMNVDKYKAKYEAETPKRYGINLGNLKGGVEHVDNCFKSKKKIGDDRTGTANGVVLCVYNNTINTDLKYESISFITKVLKSCGDFS